MIWLSFWILIIVQDCSIQTTTTHCTDIWYLNELSTGTFILYTNLLIVVTINFGIFCIYIYDCCVIIFFNFLIISGCTCSIQTHLAGLYTGTLILYPILQIQIKLISFGICCIYVITVYDDAWGRGRRMDWCEWFSRFCFFEMSWRPSISLLHMHSWTSCHYSRQQMEIKGEMDDLALQYKETLPKRASMQSIPPHLTTQYISCSALKQPAVNVIGIT